MFWRNSPDSPATWDTGKTSANGITEDNAAASAKEKLYFDTTLKNK